MQKLPNEEFVPTCIYFPFIALHSLNVQPSKPETFAIAVLVPLYANDFDSTVDCAPAITGKSNMNIVIICFISRNLIDIEDGDCHDNGDDKQYQFEPFVELAITLYGSKILLLEQGGIILPMMVMVMMVRHCKGIWSVYFKMLYKSDVNEIRMLVPVNHRVVVVPTFELRAFTLLGSTMTMSFCCK